MAYGDVQYVNTEATFDGKRQGIRFVAGTIGAYSGEKLQASDLGLTSIFTIHPTSAMISGATGSYDWLVGGLVASPGSNNNYATISVYNVGSAGYGAELGSAKRVSISYIATGH